MYFLKPSEYKAIIHGYRNFPDITITIKPVTQQNDLKETIKFLAESDYAIWTPGNPMNPYRHHGCGPTVEQAARDALNTFISQDSEYFPNDQVFVTIADRDYKNAIFIDGNGKQHSYQEAYKVIQSHKNF